LLNVFTSEEYASLDKKALGELVNLTPSDDLFQVIEALLFQGLIKEDGRDIELNLHPFEFTDYEKIMKLVVEIFPHKMMGSDLRKTLKASTSIDEFMKHYANDLGNSLQVHIAEELGVAKEVIFRDTNVEVASMLYSVMQTSKRHILKVMELIVMASSKLGLVVFGNAVKLKGKEVSTMAIPVQLFLVYLAVNYLVKNTTIGLQITAQFGLVATAASLFSYMILIMAVVYPIIWWLNKRFAPLPTEFKSAENVTLKAKMGGLGHIHRRSYTDLFIDDLQEEGHVILFGQSGSGKTSVKKEIAKRIAMDDLNEDSPLRNKTVFSFDMKKEAALQDLKELCENYINRRDEVIIFVEKAYCSEMRSEDDFDEVVESLIEYPFVVLSMNSADYNRRTFHTQFKPSEELTIDQELEGDEFSETLRMMQEYALHRYPEGRIPDDVVEEIYNLSNKSQGRSHLAQPGWGLFMMEKVISAYRRHGHPHHITSFKEKSRDHLNARTNIKRKAATCVDMTRSMYAADSQDNTAREMTKDEAKRTVRDERIAVQRIDLMARLKDSLYLSKLHYGRKCQYVRAREARGMLSRWLILERIVLPILKKAIQDEVAKRQPLIREIDKEFVQTVFPDLSDKSGEGISDKSEEGTSDINDVEIVIPDC